MKLFDVFKPRGLPPTSRHSDGPPQWMRDGLRVTMIHGQDDLEVVGESFYQEHLWTVVGGRTGDYIRQEVVATLVAEDGNPYDRNAISVWIGGGKVGYLSRNDAAAHRDGLLRLQSRHRMAIALSGVVVGGGADYGRSGLLGVFCNYDRTMFGLTPLWNAPAGSDIHSGLSSVAAAARADNNYELSWRSALPDDRLKRVAYLRQTLKHDTTPISRHYLFAELESALYSLRTDVPTALEEYDIVCLEHDAEMDQIRAALLETFGVVPRLETYRQAAIRHQKANNFDRAMWWAERGIALYGDTPAKPEMVDDLQKRAAKYRARMTDGAG